MLTLRPSLREALHELRVTEVTLPDDIERARAAAPNAAAAAAAAAASAALEILAAETAASATPTRLDVRWRPPPARAGRVAHYKLMVAAGGGSGSSGSGGGGGEAREAYCGREARARVSGLRPGREYVFAVKAVFEGGGHAWSEAAAFTTRPAGG